MASSSEESSRPSLRCGRWDNDDILLHARVQPRSARTEIGAVENSRLRIRLTAPPADGKANEQARKLLAKAFGIGVSRVSLIRGQNSRDKVFRIIAPDRLPAGIVAP